MYNDFWKASLNITRLDEAMSFLETIDNNKDEHVIITVHNPIYSPNRNMVLPELTRRLEDFLDQHQNNNIRCVLSGHTHRFSAYKRKDVLFLISPSSGGLLLK